MAHRQSTTGYRGDVQEMKARDYPHHIGDGVQRPHLVEMHLLQGQVVDRGLGAGEGAEYLHRLVLDRRRKGAAGDEAFDIREVPVLVLVRRRHVDLGGGDAELVHPRGAEAQTVQAQGVEGLLQLLQRDAGVHQGSQQHVTAGAAEQVKMNVHVHSRLPPPGAAYDWRRRRRRSRYRCSPPLPPARSW
jgi:hypothetical protein